MMRAIGLSGFAVLTLTVTAQADEAVDFSDPASVTGAIFAAATSGDDSALSGLCDPTGENDGDTQEYICDMKAGSKAWDEYVEYFAKGSVAGDAKIDGDSAQVPILFGPDGTKDETMNLVNRDGKWYLSSF